MVFLLENYSESHSITNQFGGEIDIVNAPIVVQFRLSRKFNQPQLFCQLWCIQDEDDDRYSYHWNQQQFNI
ncbi:MAG: hypothetical protein IPF52_16315 [Saprospiraceae bacterium]|nr:hypothetical protein [Saprospiraceae bacterium]